MKRNERILALIAAFIFTIVGYMQLGQTGHDLLIVSMSFFVAAVLLYTYFGKKGISSCSITQMSEDSKTLILGSETKEVSRMNGFKIGLVTFIAILVSFGLGFGVGKLIYNIIH